MSPDDVNLLEQRSVPRLFAHLKAPSMWSRKAAAATPWMLSLESGS